MRKTETGQALVLVLLSLSVVLTLILFILSRSVTDIATSGRQEESVRAFSAAEAGVERSLVVAGSNFSGNFDNNASYTTTVTDFASGGFDLNFPSAVTYGDTMTVWFTSHNANGNLACGALPCYHGSSMKVCWGNPGTSASSSTTPAIEVSVYYDSTPGDMSTLKIARATADPNTGRTSANSFSAPNAGTCQIGGQSYQFQKVITFASLGIPAASFNNANGLQLAKIRMLYNVDTPHVMGVNVNTTVLPSQGKQIDSSGNAGDSNRRIMVYQGWGESPYASNSIISPVGITK